MNGASDVRRRLLSSRLLSPETLDLQMALWRERSTAAVDGEGLVEWLIAQHLLSEFQGAAILAGHTGPFLLGPYRVYERIVAGRLGPVFRAVHDELDQPVSLKIFPTSLHAEHENLARMHRETRLAVTLDHPHVVRTFHAGQIGAIHYLAFEDLAGDSLEASLAQRQRLPYGEACALVRQAALGLDYLHEHQIVHRDLRPGTLWLHAAGAVKVMELGAARDLLGAKDGGMELTTANTILGSFAYMAPEQAQDPRKADARSDIYALGCTLFHCLTGQPPFTSSNPVRLVLRHATEPPPLASSLNGDVPPELDEMVGSMLAKHPDQRFQRASDVAWALEQFLAAEAPPVEATTPQSEFLQWLADQQTGEERLTAAPTPELVEFLDWLIYDFVEVDEPEELEETSE